MRSAGCSPLSSPLCLAPPPASVSSAWTRRGTGSCGQGGREHWRKRRRNKHRKGDEGEGRTSNRPHYQSQRKNTNKNNPQCPPSPSRPHLHPLIGALSYLKETNASGVRRTYVLLFLPQRINVWFFVNLTTSDDMTRRDCAEQKCANQNTPLVCYVL